ncbi:MAG TPA: L-threonylcarbamoyladenylate synthase [Nitrososphaerales archaeon]|nr:L-threonylcarbamoyladenylate synthase [Nitrososphaerales archaeon]
MPSARVVTIDPGSIAEAAAIVKDGGVIVFPTDTVYGLGCDPFNASAVDRLFEAKHRDTKPVPVLCSDASKAAELVTLGPLSLKLAEARWPGALTIVAKLRREVSPRLTQGTGSLGVRVPDHRQCLELVSSCGGWLTGTSANVSGAPSSRSAQDAASQVGESVDLILDGGPSMGKESTVVSESEEGLTILRTGPVGVPDEMMRRRI